MKAKWLKIKEWLKKHKWGWVLVLGLPLILFYVIYRYYQSIAASSASTGTQALTLPSDGSSSGVGGGDSSGTSDDDSAALASLQAQETSDNTTNQGLIASLGTALQNLATTVAAWTGPATASSGSNAAPATATPGTAAATSPAANVVAAAASAANQAAATVANTAAAAAAAVQGIPGAVATVADDPSLTYTGNAASAANPQGIANLTVTPVKVSGAVTPTQQTQMNTNETAMNQQIESTVAASPLQMINNFISSIQAQGAAYNSATTSAGKSQAQQEAASLRSSLASSLQGIAGWSTQTTTASNGAQQLTITGTNGYKQTI